MPADFDGDGSQDLFAIGQGIEFLRGTAPGIRAAGYDGSVVDGTAAGGLRRTASDLAIALFSTA